MKAPRILTLCCFLALLLTAPAMAVTRSGECGTNVRWTLDEAGTLTISGTGEMNGYPGWIEHSYEVTSVTMERGIASVCSSAFQECVFIESVTIPDTVESIGDCAFWGCESLSDVTVPDSVKAMGAGVFGECEALKRVELPDSVTEMGTQFFMNSTGLESFRIPSNIRFIRESAFYGCESLESVIIPASVTVIDDSAFTSCESLSDVYFAGTKAQWDAIKGGGPASLRDYGVKIHYDGSFDYEPIVISLNDSIVQEERVFVHLKATGGGGTRAILIVAFYDANGRYLSMESVTTRVYRNEGFAFDNHTDATNVKAFALSAKNLCPLCPAVTLSAQ